MTSTEILCPVCSGKCELDTGTAGSSATTTGAINDKGGPRRSSLPWHTRWYRRGSAAVDLVLQVFYTGAYRIK